MTKRKIPLCLAAALVLVASASVPSIAQAQTDAQQAAQVAAFQKLADKWSTALANQDQFTLETILAPEFVAISATGEKTSRNQQVAAMFESGEPRVETIQQKVDNVRIIEDVAIVDGTYAETTKLNGVPHAERGVYTHIYQRKHGTWMCVQSQRTALPAQPDEGKKSRKKKSLF